MPHLTAKTRALLRNTAFAYVDSKGRRRLPIHDESHVRNALARFNQTRFEDAAARERARKRLLTAAKKHGIVPIGFITGQLATERLEGESRARAAVARDLPTGQVTFLLTDIEDSTGLLRRLGDGYANSWPSYVASCVAPCIRRGATRSMFAPTSYSPCSSAPSAALAAALAIQRRVSSRAWPSGVAVRVRIGIHTGRPTLTDGGYVGLAVHTAARICAAGHGGQILLSGDAVASRRGVCSCQRYLPLAGRSPPPGPARAGEALSVGGSRSPGALPSASSRKGRP